MDSDGSTEEGSVERTREAEAYLKLSPDAVLVVDSQGRIRAANPLAEDLFGYEPQSLSGLNLEDLVPERFRSAHVRHRGGFVKEPRTRRMGGAGLELWGRRRDGSEFPVDISLAPITGPDSPMIVAAVRDMTERRAEQAAQALLAAIVTSSEDAVVSISPDGAISSWNPGAEKLFGYGSDEVVGCPGALLVPEERQGEMNGAIERALAGNRAERFETVARHRDVSEIDMEVTVSAVRDRSGGQLGVAAVLRDITERRRADAALARAQDERQQLVMLQDRERIARDLHDLVIQRLFAAGLSLQGLASRTDSEVAARLVQIVGELDTTIGEIRSTIFALEHRRDSTTSIRGRVLDLASEAASSLAHDPAVRFEGPVDAKVPDGVAEHLLAVLREALSNVARHANATTTHIELTVNSDVTLVVTDNGIGMAGATRTSGLHNLRERAESLSGSFEAESQPGGGTRLEWRVPLERPA